MLDCALEPASDGVGGKTTRQTWTILRTPTAYDAANKTVWDEDSNDSVNNHGKNWRLPPDALENVKLNRHKHSKKDYGHSEATHTP